MTKEEAPGERTSPARWLGPWSLVVGTLSWAHLTARLSRTPVALLNLLARPRRLLAAVLGVGFAVVLMFMEIGFMNGMFDSQVELIAQLDADLVLVQRAQYALVAGETFGIDRVVQARGCPGVAAACPVYVEILASVWKQPLRRRYLPIRVVAFDPGHAVLLNADVIRQAARLRDPGTALVDARSKPHFGFPDPGEEPLKRTRAELADRGVRLVGRFSLGTDFANDGTLVMSDDNFARYFPGRGRGGDPLAIVDLGVVKLDAGADAAEVQRRLDELLPDDVAVKTKAELLADERAFWARATPVGPIFITGTIVGLLVGLIVCYQVIYTDLADHQRELATLKAMGYTGRYFAGHVMKTAFYLSVLSYVPGLLVSLVLYDVLADQTGLLMRLDVFRAAIVFVLTLAMCAASGCLALRKLFAADPATLF